MNSGRWIAWARRSNAGDDHFAILGESATKGHKNAKKKQKEFSHKKSFRELKKTTHRYVVTLLHRLIENLLPDIE